MWPDKFVSGDATEDSKEDIGSSRSSIIITTLKKLAFIALVLLFMTLPMSTLYIVFTLTRRHNPKVAEDDATKESILIDAVMGGFLLPLLSICMGGVRKHLFSKFQLIVKNVVQAVWFIRETKITKAKYVEFFNLHISCLSS